MPELILVDDPAAAAAAVVDALERTYATTPDPVFGVATGSSPLAVYQEAARRVRQHGLRLDRARWFALDEYLGLPSGHRQSYRSVLEDELVGPLRLAPETLHVPNGRAADPHAEADAYEERIVAAGVDLQILGIGANGHIGFNEPGSPFDSTTRVCALAESTRVDNSRYFDALDEVPASCITQGLSTIMRARSIVLLAFGSAKAAALQAALEGPVGEHLPASILRLHGDVTIYADPAAAGLLREPDRMAGDARAASR